MVQISKVVAVYRVGPEAAPLQFSKILSPGQWSTALSGGGGCGKWYIVCGPLSELSALHLMSTSNENFIESELSFVHVQSSNYLRARSSSAIYSARDL